MGPSCTAKASSTMADTPAYLSKLHPYSGTDSLPLAWGYTPQQCDLPSERWTWGRTHAGGSGLFGRDSRGQMPGEESSRWPVFCPGGPSISAVQAVGRGMQPEESRVGPSRPGLRAELPVIGIRSYCLPLHLLRSLLQNAGFLLCLPSF